MGAGEYNLLNNHFIEMVKGSKGIFQPQFELGPHQHRGSKELVNSIKNMKFRDLIYLFYKKKRIIVLFTIFMSFLGRFTSLAIQPSYEAKAMMSLHIAKGTPGANEEIEKRYLLIDTYQKLLKSNGVLNNVNKTLNESYLKNELHKKVKLEFDTQSLTIWTKEKSPEKAKQLANTLAATFQEEVRASMKTLNVVVINEDAVDEDLKSITPITILFFTFSAIIGIVLSYFFVLIQEMFLTILDSPEKIKRALKLPILGNLPFTDGKLISELPLNHETTDSFREIQKNIKDFPGKILLVSSAESGDGKSFVSANLSVAFATNQKKTVYVDLDLRRATQNTFFNLPKDRGVTSFILETCELNEIIQETEVTNLSFISTGTSHRNPTELLASEKFAEFFEELKENYDAILVDTSPLNFPDTLKISAMVDGCLFVVNAETSKLEQTIHSIEQLKSVQAPILGIILNKSKGYSHSGRLIWPSFRRKH